MTDKQKSVGKEKVVLQTQTCFNKCLANMLQKLRFTQNIYDTIN